MAFNVANLNLENVSTLAESAEALKDPDHTDEVTVGFLFRDTSELPYAIPDSESFIAFRLGVDTDEDGAPYGINYNSTVLRGLVDAYGKKGGTTKPEILIARYDFTATKKYKVAAQYILPLMIPGKKDLAVVSEAHYDVNHRKYKSGDRTELTRTQPHVGRLRDNPFYVAPKVTVDPYQRADYAITRRAIGRGTIGTS